MMNHMSNHSIYQCTHGTVIQRCRCMGPHTIITKTECPDHCEFKGQPAGEYPLNQPSFGPDDLIFEIDVERRFTEKVFVVAVDAEVAQAKIRKHLNDQVLYTSSGLRPEDVPVEILSQVEGA